MVDRLEELLAQVADEDDEEQEDALALEAERALPAVPESREESGRESRPELENRKEPGQTGDETVTAPMDNGEPWAAVPRAAGVNPPAGGGPEARYENELTAPRMLRAGGSRMAEGPKPASAEGSAEVAPTPAAVAERGLEELYRRAAQAARPAAQSLPVEQAGRTRHAEEPGRAAALTVDELDRAVRRDSRRYDGGITIF